MTHQAWVRRHITPIFGPTVNKVLIGFNSEYNDEYYDYRGLQYIECYNKDNEFMIPNDMEKFRKLLRNDNIDTYDTFVKRDESYDKNCGLSSYMKDVVINMENY